MHPRTGSILTSTSLKLAMSKMSLNFLKLDFLKELRSTSPLKKLAIRGAVWTIVGYGAGQVLRFGSNLILTRMLAPEFFGLMTLITTFYISVHLFSDIGIAPNIIQSKRGNDPVFLNTAWTVQIIRSFLVWFVLILITWPISKFYGDSRFLWLIPVMGFASIIEGFTSTNLITLNRNLDLKKLTLFELGMQILSLVILVVWAYFSPSIWALVGGNLISTVIRVLSTHLLFSKWPNRFAWEQETVRDMFSFGKWIFVSTAMTFLADQVDRLILGKIFSLEMLGVYNIALVLSSTPRQITSALSGKVIFPAVAKLLEHPREIVRAKILRNRRPILFGCAFGLTLLIAFGDLLILALYDHRYSQAAWMVPILALGMWPRLLCDTIEPALYAIGKPGYSAVGNFLRFLFTLVGIPLGFFLMGVAGAITAIALNDLVFYGVINYGFRKEGLTGTKQDVQFTMLFFTLLMIALGCREILGFGLPVRQLFLP
jgi:O-antigen/teichoic acid export membrane protein